MKNMFEKGCNFIKSHLMILLIVIIMIIAVILVVGFITGGEKRAIKKYISALNSSDSQKIIEAQDIKAMIAFDKGYYIDENGKENNQDLIKNFDKAILTVTDEEVKEYEDGLKESYEGMEKGAETMKLIKVVSKVTAKDNSDLKRVVCKVRIKSKPVTETNDEQYNDEDTSIEELEVNELDEDIDNETVVEDENYVLDEETVEEIDNIEIENNDSDDIEYDVMNEEDVWNKGKDFTREIETYANFILYKDKVISVNYDI